MGCFLLFFIVSLLMSLLDLLASSGAGVYISDMFCGAPMYADDLSLIAATPCDMQCMLDIVYDYSNKWRYQFNTTQSVDMVFGESHTEEYRLQARTTRYWHLVIMQLREVDEYHHLGILKTVSISTIAGTNERVSSAHSAFYALQSVGSRFGSLLPLISLHLYRSLCLPILLYGSGVWTLPRQSYLC